VKHTGVPVIMVLETLTRSQKLGLLGLLVGIGVAAVVIPLVAVGGGGGDDKGNNLTQAEVLKQIRKELRDMAEQLRIHLNSSTFSSTSSSPPTSVDQQGAEESAAKVSVESRRRKKRQAPNLPPPPPPQQAPTPAAAAAAPLTTSLPAAGAPLTAINAVANNTVEGSSSTDTNASITSTAATISTTISPLLLLVDETSNVLEMLEKTDKQILEAANTTASSSPGEEAQLVGKIAQLRAKVGRIELHSPADRQLASDLLTRVLTAEQDVTRTLEAVQVKEVEVVAKRKQQAVESLSRMNSTLAQLLNNLSLKLNSRLNADEQTPANASALVNPVSNTSAANISLAAGSEANSSGEQNSSIISISFSTLQTELGEELEAGTQTLTGLADNPTHLSDQSQTALDSLEKSLARLTAALPTLTVKDEEERGAGRVLLASLEVTKRETSRALASLAVDEQQVNNSGNNTTPAIGLLASNGSLAGGEVGSAGSETTLTQSVGGGVGGAAVDVTPLTTAAAAAAASLSSAAAAVTPIPAAPPASP